MHSTRSGRDAALCLPPFLSRPPIPLITHLVGGSQLMPDCAGKMDPDFQVFAYLGEVILKKKKEKEKRNKKKIGERGKNEKSGTEKPTCENGASVAMSEQPAGCKTVSLNAFDDHFLYALNANGIIGNVKERRKVFQTSYYQNQSEFYSFFFATTFSQRTI
eukprot:TRINITY_DN2810_c8_g1_i1.p1 TRINITY_DN2810_c8_g1~~TRINITY_DN2810_c8_g1_i1.p1  ORF type:complete len:161 (+),score=17.65 TRINITY_DN2810_c8_g1_i1:102-584(+)